MKRLFLMAILMAGALATTATSYEYPYMNFLTTDGTLQTMTVDGMTLSFTDGTMVVSNSSDSKSYTLTQMDKMYFTQTSGLSELVNTSDESVEVYNAAGMLMGHYDNAKQAIQALDRGIYVLKSKSTTLKIAVK